MGKDDCTSKKLGKVIKIDEGQVKTHLQEMVIDTVEQTLNGYLDEEAEKLWRAKR